MALWLVRSQATVDDLIAHACNERDIAVDHRMSL
jgi:hypothetical protein